jgi:hypothetical protein
LDKGSAPPVPDEDGLTIVAATSPSSNKDSRTYKTSSKCAIPITTSITLTHSRSEDTSVRQDYGGGLDDAPIPIQGRFGRCTPIEILACWLKRSPSEGRSSGVESGERELAPLILLLNATSQRFRLKGRLLPPHPCGCPGGAPSLPPLPLFSQLFIVDTVGLPPRRILG